MLRRPLFWFTVFFCLGIIAVYKTRVHFLLVCLLTVIFLALSFISIKQRPRFILFFSAVIFLLGVAATDNFSVLPKCHISKFVFYGDSRIYKLKGFINSEPDFKHGRAIFIFQAEEVQFDNLKTKCCGAILVYARPKIDLRYGEELIISGRMSRPFNFGTQNRRAYRDYLYQQGIYAILRLENKSPIIRLNRNKGFVLKRFALQLKERAKRVFSRYSSPLAAGILGAMVLGERRDIPYTLYSSMVKSGTVHILVVSGFNVGIVAYIIFLILKLLRLPRKIRIIIIIPPLILYCLVTGASNPVVRATIMAIIFLLSYLFKREADIYNSLSLAVLFILCINPYQLFDIGFQLSFASVISIVYLYPKIKTYLRLDIIKYKPLQFLIDGFLVSLSAWLGTMGFLVYYFKIISPLTVLANIFIVPIATLITLCGFSLIITGPLYPPLASLFAQNCELLSSLLININNFLIRIPFAYFYI